MKKIWTVIMALALALGLATTAAAKTIVAEAPLETDAFIGVDVSGSMQDQEAARAKLAELDLTECAEPRYFDSAKVTTDAEYAGGHDSNLCEVINLAVEGNHEHITLITDGHQWPAEYSDLGVYTDVDITIILTEEIDADVQSFLGALQDSLSESSLKVVTPEGEELILLDEYEAPTVFVEVEIPETEQPGEVGTSSESTTEEVCDHQCAPCRWWWAILPAVLLSALIAFILDLLWRRRKVVTEQPQACTCQPQQPVAQQPQACTCQKSFPCRECPFEEYQREKHEQALVSIMGEGDLLLDDVSYSMNPLKAIAEDAVKKAKPKNLLAFAERAEMVAPEALQTIYLGGNTHGWEAVELAEAHGYDKLVIVSDLQFNGKPYDELQLKGKFQKISVFVPKKGYSAETLEQLRKIANNVEVYYWY